eukprot:Nk52_evm1s1311 gene=Nk52_evmTU1s1311
MIPADPDTSGMSISESSPSGGVSSTPTEGSDAVTPEEQKFLDLLPAWVKPAFFRLWKQPLNNKILELESKLALAEAKAARLETLVDADVKEVGAELQITRFESLDMMASCKNVEQNLLDVEWRTLS